MTKTGTEVIRGTYYKAAFMSTKKWQKILFTLCHLLASYNYTRLRLRLRIKLQRFQCTCCFFTTLRTQVAVSSTSSKRGIRCHISEPLAINIHYHKHLKSHRPQFSENDTWFPFKCTWNSKAFLTELSMF